MREEMITSFINCLKKDDIPWRQTWSAANRPFNAVTDTEYHGVNALWLSYNQAANNFRDPRWCTFKQAQTKGWKIKAGAKGTKVEFWSLYDTQDKIKITQREAKILADELSLEEFKERIKPISNTYTVFNGEQIEGISQYEVKTNKLNLEDVIKRRDILIKNMALNFEERGDSAYYSPQFDRITLPTANLFESEYAYMATLLHEAGHATGHESRLNRDLTGAFGSPEYAKEELRAEIASAFTAQTLGINYEQNGYMENHEAYVQSWIKVLESEPNELFAAIKDAEKISDYLIDKGEFESPLKVNEQQIIKKMDTYVAMHREYTESYPLKDMPIVINGYGGPGAGKSTACMEITAELKKAGYRAEYVQEYAKELVYENNMEMLDGSAEHQFEILKEQTKRVDRLFGKTDFIVTDSPVMLNAIYNKELTPEYEALIYEMQGAYIDFSFFMERNTADFEKEGRIHNLNESIEKDSEIKQMLQKNEIDCKTYNHDNVMDIVKDAIHFYEDIKPKDIKKEAVRNADITVSGVQAARFRMAMKGQEKALDTFLTDDKLEEHVKQDSLSIGKEVAKYMEEGLSVSEIIMTKAQEIDDSCNLSNPAYTKNLIAGLYAKTNEEYRSLKELPNLWNEKEMVEISEGLAEQLVYNHVPVTSGKEKLEQIENPREFQSYKGIKFFANETALSNALKNIPGLNAIRCEQSETEGFEKGKAYTAREYDYISRETDREYNKGRDYLIQRYKTQENIENIKNPEEQKYITPKINKFTAILKGEEHSGSMSFGEGKGGFNSQVSHMAYSEEIQDAINKDEQFRNFADKIKDVFEFENSKNIPKEFRTTTENMEVINRDMLLTQHDLINDMHQESHMVAPEKNVINYFKNSGIKNTKAKGMNRRIEMEL